jgi:ABC-type enterochelin transport system permease subunit
MLTTKDITRLMDIFATKEEFHELKNEFFNRFDAVMVELKAIREELTVITGRQSMHTDVLENHEEQLVLLEGKSGLQLKDKIRVK